MARPRKHVRDPEVPARSFNEIQRVVEMALTLYRLMGGESLDLQLRSMDRTAEMYQLQTDAALQYGQDPGAFGPTVNPYESRMSASTYARLNAQREKKIAQCMAWAEEGAEASAAAKAAAASNPAVAGGEALEREASASGREAATTTQPQTKDGDSPSAKGGRGQPPAPEAGEYEFIDATKRVHPEALSTRIGALLDDIHKATNAPSNA